MLDLAVRLQGVDASDPRAASQSGGAGHRPTSGSSPPPPAAPAVKVPHRGRARQGRGGEHHVMDGEIEIVEGIKLFFRPFD
jgi:hypothetical protein